MNDPALFDFAHLVVPRRCDVCGGALSLSFTHTYIVRRQCWVKIGATNRPRARFNELARYDWRKYVLSPPAMDWHQPLHRVLVIEANIEHALHAMFADYHVRGEWFLETLTIRKFLEEVDHAQATG